MDAKEIRQTFLDYFRSKEHKIVPSAPIVTKDDPSLMFTNAGMNQFKDYFLGNSVPEFRRVADTQRCLRVSGKHNDLEEVGRDGYHHTMFEMLGNWSFGDYFKKEAIEWAWELLIDKFGMDKDRIYVSIFGGDQGDNLQKDKESFDYWSEYVSKERILAFGKKENFWEMGDTGPCGPCSEIHIDLRTDADRQKIDGRELVNADHPLVIELWNLVFIQFNRKTNGTLEQLAEKHVDTGMGFERLCMAIQHKKSNYDTNEFASLIREIEQKTNNKYGFTYQEDNKSDIAIRVVADHLRAVCFAIADGELPSNTGAGYVIRRILRRAVRYYYSFLHTKTPLLFTMVKTLANQFKDVFPVLFDQQKFVTKVIEEEEKSFLSTLEDGLKRIENVQVNSNVLSGKVAFELFDTYGFPIDLTRIIAYEKGWKLDENEFNIALEEQKRRSREDAMQEKGDWIEVKNCNNLEFAGYDNDIITNVSVVKYRKISKKEKEFFQLILDKTPFYPEGGGQIGDSGMLEFDDEKIEVIDTKKENSLILHYVKTLPSKIASSAVAIIHKHRRRLIENNHSATHLVHAALREIVGDHVHQKGSLVKEDSFRFDFNHFEKVSNEQISEVERRVNEKIRQNIAIIEDRNIEMKTAIEAGAMRLFGEKYGDYVRMITIDPQYSVELCGGCHVDYTGRIGFLKIINETGIAAGVRRIEAVTSKYAENFVIKKLEELQEIKALFKNPNHTIENVKTLQSSNKNLSRELEKLRYARAADLKNTLISDVKLINDIQYITSTVENLDLKTVKVMAQNIAKLMDNAIIGLGLVNGQKVNLVLAISPKLIDKKSMHAGDLMKKISPLIEGRGGGKASLATAGGRNADGLNEVYKSIISSTANLDD